MESQPAYQEKGILDMGTFVEIQDLESCACTGDDDLAMALAYELSHQLIGSELMLANHYL
jgi:hypothetical protein